MVTSQYIKTIVFDFDGTLVQSNTIKYDAWFEIFRHDQKLTAALRQVLVTDLEASRYLIIRKVFERVDSSLSEEDLAANIARYAERYGEAVFKAVKICPEMEGATSLLEVLSERKSIYCSSNTPETDLVDIIKFRGWESYFTAIYGYPRKKNDTVKMILARENLSSRELLVVGDGVSDEISAISNGVRFHEIASQEDLKKLMYYHLFRDNHVEWKKNSCRGSSTGRK